MNFTEFITEQKNTHMTHLEDKVLYGGVKGTRDAILALRSLRDTLGGTHDGSVSVKWDGAPAVFAGIDPGDGRFFVAKKGIFNKSPKVYKSNSDIDNDTSGDLNTKLKAALKYLPELGIQDVIQGDFLFDKSDIKESKIKGKKYITFHPNTIVYAIPIDTEMATAIKKAKIGIVWHTTYKGKTFETMKASYGVNVSKLRNSPNVWQQDAMLREIILCQRKIRRKLMNTLVTLVSYSTKSVLLHLRLWSLIMTLLNLLKHIITLLLEKVKLLPIQLNMWPDLSVGSRKDMTPKYLSGKQKKVKQVNKQN